jgi:NADPH:quinone reductase-like Zn-dependent oxidoreductase
MTTSNGAPSITQTAMSAVVHNSYGSSEVLHLAEVDTPTIAADEVLVHVRAAGLNRGTWHLMTGQPYLMRLMGFGLRRPKQPIAGQEMAGVVTAIGAGVMRFAPGDEVFGIARGSFAEYAAAKQDKVSHKPASLSFEQAAAVPISASTALQGLRDAGRIKAGDKVLVLGASGGVGTYAVQIATALGAEVTGVCSTAKLDLVRSVGAHAVIDYTRESFAEGAGRYDLILDLAGNHPLRLLRRSLTPSGTLVVAGGEEGGKLTGVISRSLRALLLSPFVGQRLAMLVSKEHHRYLEDLAPLLESGQVISAIDRTYPLAEAAAAMRRLEDGLVRGKIVITL